MMYLLFKKCNRGIENHHRKRVQPRWKALDSLVERAQSSINLNGEKLEINDLKKFFFFFFGDQSWNLMDTLCNPKKLW